MKTSRDFYPNVKLIKSKSALYELKLISPRRVYGLLSSWCKSALIFCLGLLLITLWTNNALAQGALTNGWTHTGAISSAGESDSWTFSAASGDRIVIRVGEITQTNAFTPRIRLQNPSAVL